MVYPQFQAFIVIYGGDWPMTNALQYHRQISTLVELLYLTDFAILESWLKMVIALARLHRLRECKSLQ